MMTSFEAVSVGTGIVGTLLAGFSIWFAVRTEHTKAEQSYVTQLEARVVRLEHEIQDCEQARDGYLRENNALRAENIELMRKQLGHRGN